MPTIYDNIEKKLLEGLRVSLKGAKGASFAIGYFHLRGWGEISDLVDAFSGRDEDACCRILVGMHRPPEEEMRLLQGLARREEPLDGPAVARLKRQIVESFKRQLTFGLPSNEAEITLQQLARHLRAKKARIKSYLRHPLHAKLYLVHRQDPLTPLIGFIGSSNFTRPGLTEQGELNVDVVEQDAALKLLEWFEERWKDSLALDLTDELARLVEGSWACRKSVRPYLVYLKIAYHLSEEARTGEREFKIPKIFSEKGTPLLDFQTHAVSLAAHHLHRRNGALLGDVVGLGKTFMAMAIARIFQEDDDSNTLVICPPKLIPMWEWYKEQYEINGRVVSLGEVIDVLPQIPRYRLLIIDESHNLRNREGKRYQAILDYIEQNEPRVLLLTATPYNKHFEDLSAQIRLFVNPDEDLRIRPERLFQEWAKNGKTERDFIVSFGIIPTSLGAFEKSDFSEDWRDLMRLFLVRRTRSFIIRNYAKFDEDKKRYYVMLGNERAYFPQRNPQTLKFPLNENDPMDQYAKLLHDEVVQVIEDLHLPRYGLAQYLTQEAEETDDPEEKKIISNLNRAGRRLIGFCRTNLFKRLESSGYSFLLSVKRHILRNLVALYAWDHDLPIPIGIQDPALLDTALSDADVESLSEEADEWKPNTSEIPQNEITYSWDELSKQAERIYQYYANNMKSRFQWLDKRFFSQDLQQHLREDAEALFKVLLKAGEWRAEDDQKLKELYLLLVKKHPDEKVLVFTQFADTADYLEKELRRRGIKNLAVSIANTSDPVALARQFSPRSNGGLRPGETELRVLIATDVLAEGQNLQDCYIVVNYDLPWAIIRLIQRAGRVDRIGQQHDTILIYSFLPADQVEQLIRLRQRLYHRLRINQEVIGTDESFFGEEAATRLRDLYTEKAGILDDDQEDEDIDLASLALQVWNSASEADQRSALNLPDMVSATMPLREETSPPGVIAYLRFPDGTDALVRVDVHGNLVSQSLSAIFRACACAPDTPPQVRWDHHHELVARCVEEAVKEQQTLGGHLGSLRSVARKVYERLNRYRTEMNVQPSLFGSRGQQENLEKAIDLIYRYPLKERAREALRRQLRLGITDEDLAAMVLRFAEDGNLCQVKDDEEKGPQEPQIICSLGLRQDSEGEESHEG
jgi:superfamily II DNA or RNA helicase